MLRIKRQNDTRQVPCILHRIADIPGGVTVDIETLGGSILYEGTPIAVGADGKYNVCKTAKIVTEAANNATAYEVAKGHHFKVGQFLGTGTVAYAITAIDKTAADKDVITVGTTLGVALAVGAVLYEATAASADAAVAKNATPVAVVGSSYDVVANDNLMCEAFVMAVVKESASVPVLAAQKTALKSVIYI